MYDKTIKGEANTFPDIWHRARLVQSFMQMHYVTRSILRQFNIQIFRGWRYAQRRLVRNHLVKQTGELDVEEFFHTDGTSPRLRSNKTKTPLVCHEWVTARAHHAEAAAHVESYSYNRGRRAVGASCIGAFQAFGQRAVPANGYQQDITLPPTPHEIAHPTSQLNECLGLQLC